MNDKDWRTLIYSLERGNCIPVLGPEIPLPVASPGEMPLPAPYASKSSLALPEMLANRLSIEIQVTNLDPYSLAQVAEFYRHKFGRNDLEMEAQAFYRQAPRSALYDQLARVPYSLLISLSQDDGLIDALRQAGRSPVVETYDFRGDEKAFIGLGRDDVGTVEKPVIYNLYGHFKTPSSLVLTENDILDFLTAVISKTPDLPSDLRSQLQDNHKSFLLLGFGLTRWYLRILLHILKVNKRDTRSFALERFETRDVDLLEKTILFMSKGLRVESYDCDVTSFVEELAQRVADAGLAVETQAGDRPASAEMLREKTELDQAPKLFISYASEDRPAVERLYQELQTAGFKPWFDRAGLRGGDRWDEVIREALNEVDYVIVLQSLALGHKMFSYVNKEIALALERQQLARRGIRYLIPVSLDGSPPLDELEHLQAIDLRQPGGVKDLVSTILRDQQRRRKRIA